jgi:hypothetical protein
MNFEFLIVFTSNGLVFATLLYLIMSCEIPDHKGSSRSRIWAKIEGMINQNREARSSCHSSMVVPGTGALILLEAQEQQISSFGPPVNKL